MVTRIALMFFILTGLFACTKYNECFRKKKNSSAKHERFIKSKKVGWLNMEVFMKPAAALLTKFVEQEGDSESALSDFKKDIESMTYFDLRVSVNAKPGDHIENYQVSSKFEQDQRLQYLSFSMRNDIYLEQKNKRIPCELFHFERNYSLSDYRSFTLGFPTQNLSKQDDITFVFDSEYLGTGPIKIRYNSNDFSEATQIEL